ncbi:MAG: hypothetical protein COA42_02830 [Alteromonadaceae bacterium]|nr:MAG: hypothetical protein COA42_02830 [Alteromonadaceae bacterium]
MIESLKTKNSPKTSTPRIIRSFKKEHFQLLLSAEHSAHPAANKVNNNWIAIRRFVREQLDVSSVSWYNLMSRHFPEIELSAHDQEGHVFDAVAKLALRGRIRFFHLPPFKHFAQAETLRGDSYCFVPGPEPLPSYQSSPLPLDNFALLQSVLESLCRRNPEEGFWQRVLIESTRHDAPMARSSESAQAQVKARVLSGELRLYPVAKTA